MKKLIILTAMDEEFGAIESKLTQIRTLKKHTVEGMLGPQTVILSKVHIGKVNAAIHTTKLILEHTPSQLVMTGLAGALNPSYSVGDVFIAQKCFQHDYGFHGPEALITRKPNTMPEVGLGSVDDSPIHSLPINHQMQQQIQTELSEFSSQVHFGTLATGDQFIANEDAKKRIRMLGADVVEMEGAAVAEVGRQLKVPVMLIRTISDAANGDSVEDFPKFLQETSERNAEYVQRLVQTLEV